VRYDRRPRLIREAEAQGVRLLVEGAKLKWRSKSPIHDELLGRLREHKPEIFKGMKPAIDRRNEDHPFPDRHTTIDEVATRITRRARIGPRVEPPEFIPRRRVEGIDVAPGPRRVHNAVDHDRRRFLAARRPQVIRPGKSEPADVACVDLRQR
jgi:TubC N-terminal docking domain